MEYLIGVGLAVVGCAFAMLTRFDRERVFYPTLRATAATVPTSAPMASR